MNETETTCLNCENPPRPNDTFCSEKCSEEWFRKQHENGLVREKVIEPEIIPPKKSEVKKKIKVAIVCIGTVGLILLLCYEFLHP